MVDHTTLRAANIARQNEWDKDNQITLAYRGNELAGEVGEACNLIKKIERERLGIVGSRATKEQLAEELADVVICADLIAMSENIDLDASVEAKFNATTRKVGLTTFLSLASHTSALAERDARIAELEAALKDVRGSVKNARGAVESNQVVDKDVHGTLSRAIAKIDAALAKEQDDA